MNEDALDAAVHAIASGGCVIYPTETLFALGADATDASAAARLYVLKGRDPSKPLPLVVGGLEQLLQVTDMRSRTLDRLAALFWPGPLSILVPARPGLPNVVSDPRGLTSVRVTPHPVAARLCRESRRPLVATSANISGRPGVSRVADLDPELVERVDAVVDAGPRPAGGAPSTVVEIGGSGDLLVLREGAVSLDALREAGFDPYLA